MITINIYLLLKIVAAILGIGYLLAGIVFLCINGRKMNIGWGHTFGLVFAWPLYLLVLFVLLRSK
jgi:hypothetical protein